MSLSFLVPAFLAGLAALGIPILIHLTRKETSNSQVFPSLMFIRQLPFKSTSRRAIDRWPLLVLRLLGLLLLVFAFSRPFFSRNGVGLQARTDGGREVVVLLDRSYSMAIADRWERAMAAAEQAVDGIGAADRGTVLLFDSRAEAVSATSIERAELRASLNGLKPGPRTTRYAPALRYAQRILSGSALPRREVVLISDFQQSGWDADAADAGSIHLPAGTVVTPVNVAGDATPSNLAVMSLAIERSVSEDRERATLSARLTASGRLPESAPIVLEVGDRPVETREATFAEDGTAEVRFNPITLSSSGALRGRIRLPEDGLAADNLFNFVLSPDQRIGALIVEGPGTPPGASVYLLQALSLGQNPGFRVEVRNVARLTAADIQGYPVMIFNQTPLPSGEVGRRLRARVEGGTGLVLVAGDNSLGDWEGILPVLGRTVDRSSEGGTTLGFVDMGHPVFEPFSAPRSGDFTAARIFQYRPLTSPAARVLARFGDGGAALVEQPAGKGRVMVWSSRLDNRWNDLALQPVFLPFVHQVAKYAAGYSPSSPWRVVGEPFDPGAVDPYAAPYTLALTPAGERVSMQDGRPIPLEEPGFYELRDQRTGDRGALVAVNVDPAESALATFDPNELVAAVTTAPDAATTVEEAVPLTLEERERRQSAWWYLLLVVFLILAAESVISNRFYRATSPTRG